MLKTKSRIFFDDGDDDKVAVRGHAREKLWKRLLDRTSVFGSKKSCGADARREDPRVCRQAVSVGVVKRVYRVFFNSFQ